jgi:DNA-binding XRE family transcriptional regulator
MANRATDGDPGKSEIQVVSEKARALYGIAGSPVLLQQITQVYRITIREFASIFNISKAHAEDIIKHRKLPSLPLAVEICRYFEVTVEELFAWRVDDDGKRRPLIAEDPKTGMAYRLSESNLSHRTMALVEKRLEEKELQP